MCATSLVFFHGLYKVLVERQCSSLLPFLSPPPTSLQNRYPAKLSQQWGPAANSYADELYKIVWIIKVSEESYCWHHLGQARCPRVKQSQVLFLSLPLISCVPLSKLLNLSEPQLPHLESEYTNELTHTTVMKFKVTFCFWPGASGTQNELNLDGFCFPLHPSFLVA